MKHERDKHEPRQHPKDARRHYHQARQLKRYASALVQSVPNAIITRGAR